MLCMRLLITKTGRKGRCAYLAGSVATAYLYLTLSVSTLSSHPRIGYIYLPVPLHKRLRLYTKREVIERKSLAARTLSSITFI